MGQQISSMTQLLAKSRPAISSNLTASELSKISASILMIIGSNDDDDDDDSSGRSSNSSNNSDSSDDDDTVLLSLYQI